MQDQKHFVIFGATGNMGGHAARQLLERGERVTTVTRNPNGPRARALEQAGARIAAADLNDQASLEPVVAGARAVFSVQNWVESGAQAEIDQGCRLADVCKAAGVSHVVYGSAGTGQPNTGLAHFDSKLVVEQHMRSLDLPVTILRPAPFMELMTEPEFYPAVGVWGGERKIVGVERLIPWVAARDIGTAIANAFANPTRWAGADLTLVSDVKSLAEARALHETTLGHKPKSFPLPIWLVRKLAGKELVDMWQWMPEWLDARGREGLEAERERTRELVPELTSMRRWYESKRRARRAA